MFLLSNTGITLDGQIWIVWNVFIASKWQTQTVSTAFVMRNVFNISLLKKIYRISLVNNTHIVMREVYKLKSEQPVERTTTQAGTVDEQGLNAMMYVFHLTTEVMHQQCLANNLMIIELSIQVLSKKSRTTG